MRITCNAYTTHVFRIEKQYNLMQLTGGNHSYIKTTHLPYIHHLRIGMLFKFQTPSRINKTK